MEIVNQFEKFLETLRAKGILCTLAWEFEKKPFIIECYMFSYEKKFITVLAQIWPEKHGFTLYTEGTTSNSIDAVVGQIYGLLNVRFDEKKTV